MVASLPIVIVIFYYFFLVFVILANIELTKVYSRILNTVFLCSVLVVAYNFIPTQQMDLYRYYLMLDEVEHMDINWNQIINYGPYRQTILTSIYFNIMSKIENRSWFVIFPTGMVFSLIFFVSNKFRKDYNITYSSFAFFMVSIISVSSVFLIITGVRQNLAWSLLMVAVYYDFFSKEKKRVMNVVLYVLPLLVHLSAAPIVVLRLVLILVKKFPFLKYLLILWPLSLIIFTNIHNYLPPILQSSLVVLGRYVENVENYIPTAQFAVAIVSYVLILFLITSMKKRNTLANFISKDYYNFYYLVLLFGISSIFIPTLFSRTFELVIYISLPMFSSVLTTKFNFRLPILLIIIAMFVVLFYWQDLMLGYFF
ncbi:hypothetical protein G7058_03670 [Jeotgalibaca porci]|uniref:EpsG family protein n=1 Tax=Jeotgalibaca porci TaxID=1868793 RepID=A0A6G7WG70_9LACT|nr:EpsG family protein [Jeotgalibaca porci]QIK51232.1 hypothetical protein G7058_03670 [Jeotgalibaca porci]